MRQFGNLGDFIAHLTTRVYAVDRAITHGLTVGARIVADEAKHEIGTYQSAAGPFDAWPALAESTLEGWRGYPGKRELGYAPPDNPLLRTGALRDAIEYSVEHHEGAVGVPDRMVSADGKMENVGDVAVWQELGTTKIPARSFLGRAGFVKHEKVAEAVALEVIHAISGIRPTP